MITAYDRSRKKPGSQPVPVANSCLATLVEKNFNEFSVEPACAAAHEVALYRKLPSVNRSQTCTASPGS
jgi:hypothetical protein